MCPSFAINHTFNQSISISITTMPHHETTIALPSWVLVHFYTFPNNLGLYIPNGLLSSPSSKSESPKFNSKATTKTFNFLDLGASSSLSPKRHLNIGFIELFKLFLLAWFLFVTFQVFKCLGCVYCFCICTGCLYLHSPFS